MPTETDWTPPDLDNLTYTRDFGTSVIEQFVRSHTPADMLKELVQNEYDAGGRTLDICFGDAGLSITGSGANIDRNGWKRLSVWLGTGLIAGGDRSGQAIPPKVNGIGSKNFGIRSLFLIGDRIVVRSGGQFTVLDVRQGTLPTTHPDPASATFKGVRIEVPYRTEPNGALEAFDEAHEQAYLDGMADALGPLLIKLAEPRSRRSLHRLEVSSQRCDRVIVWQQSAKALPTTAGRGFSAMHRKIVVRDSAMERQPLKVEEVEFQRLIGVPKDVPAPDVPGYYRAAGKRRIRLGVSFAIRNRKVVQTPGRFFYPLGIGGHTGTALSVNAPFEMSDNRSEILDTAISAWNEWLIEQTGELVARLLPTDWWYRFGTDAYRGMVWPTNAEQGKAAKKRVFAKAAEVVVADEQLTAA